MDKENTGLLIRKKRIELGLTQEELADILNVSKNTVSRWERGLNLPDLSVLETLAETLKISVPEMIAGEEKETVGASETKLLDSYVKTRRLLLIGLLISAVILADVLYGYLATQLAWDISDRYFRPKGIILSLLYNPGLVKNNQGVFLEKSFKVLPSQLSSLHPLL